MRVCWVEATLETVGLWRGACALSVTTQGGGIQSHEIPFKTEPSSGLLSYLVTKRVTKLISTIYIFPPQMIDSILGCRPETKPSEIRAAGVVKTHCPRVYIRQA